jgi:hypothetical protein
MSLIRSFIPEDDYGRPQLVSGSRRPQLLTARTDAPPFGVVRPKVPHLPVAMAVECIRPTQTLNTGQRLIAVPWRKIDGAMHYLIRIDHRALYVPVYALRPLAARHDHLFPHWKRDSRKAA